MKISWNWLKEYLPIDIDVNEAADILTRIGLEVEDVIKHESIRGGLAGLKVGFVKEVNSHPNADKLRITKVDVGGVTDLQIVCGAPNVAIGQKVIVAVDGTTVHPVTGEPFKIKKLPSGCRRLRNFLAKCGSNRALLKIRCLKTHG